MNDDRDDLVAIVLDRSDRFETDAIVDEDDYFHEAPPFESFVIVVTTLAAPFPSISLDARRPMVASLSGFVRLSIIRCLSVSGDNCDEPPK